MGPQPKKFDARGLKDLADRVDAIVGRLRWIESALRNPPKGGPKVFEMVFEKADTNIDYLEEWSGARERKLKAILKKLEKKARMGGSKATQADPEESDENDLSDD